MNDFHVGQKLKILDDRREDWQPKHELTVMKVYDHGFRRGTGHHQSLDMTNGQTYSGWWFDPEAECLWAKKGK